jgi:hypothetical protein
MTKKQMSARIAELEVIVASLTTALQALAHPIYVAPVPAMPTVNPFVSPTIQPSWPPYTPYIGDPPPNTGSPRITWGSSIQDAISVANQGLRCHNSVQAGNV